MLYLISIPSFGASFISLESILYRLDCPMNVPFTVGVPPSEAGSNKGTMVAGGSSDFDSETDAAGLSGILASTFARSVSRNSFPVPRGSMPYSAGRTAVTSKAAAMMSAATAAFAILFFEGGWTVTVYVSSVILFLSPAPGWSRIHGTAPWIQHHPKRDLLCNKISGELESDEDEAAHH